MSLDRSLETYHELYAESVSGDKAVIDNAFDAAQQVLKSYGFDTANDDRAEDLVSAIAKYVVRSGNGIV